MPTGPCPARYLIVGEAPGEQEEARGEPFVGYSGQELDRMLQEAGIMRSECMLTNVCRVRPAHNDISNFFSRKKKAPDPSWTKHGDAWLHAYVEEGLRLLGREIELCQPTVVIALGNLSLWALTGKWGITDWRGSLLHSSTNPNLWVLPTYHPAAVLRQWSWRPYVISDLRRAKLLCTEKVIAPRYDFITAPSFIQTVDFFNRMFTRLRDGPVHISCDIETRHGHIACIGFAWSATEAFCIPLMAGGKAEGYWSENEEWEIYRLCRDLLEHSNIRISGQNFIYDAQYLWRWLRVVPRLAFDTMVAHHVCWPGTDKGLDTLSSLYCRFHVFWKNEGKEWAARQDENVLWRYNCEDAVRTWEIAEELIRFVKQLGMEAQCIAQHRTWWLCFETMNLGVKMDKAAKAALSLELVWEVTNRETWIADVLGHELNVRSPKQLRALFYEDFKLPPVINRTTGLPTCNEEALTKLANKEPLLKPLVRRILEIRSLGVFRATFVDGKLDRDGRMRCSYNVAGTETFRLSSSENAFGSGMNLQNVPKGGKDEDEDFYELPNVRKLFVFDNGMEGFDLDLDQADLRIVVEESGEEELRAMLATGASTYVEVAKEFYHDPTFSKKHPRYRDFKSLIHGTHYLGTAGGLAQRLGLLVRETERVQNWYLSRFPRIKRWQADLRKQVDSRRYVRNAFGYRRYYFDRLDGTIYNQAAAWIPQSTIGILINRIWDNLRTHEPELQILLQVHDSLVGQYPHARRSYFLGRINTLAKVAIPYPNPLVIPIGIKTSTASWGDCD